MPSLHLTQQAVPHPSISMLGRSQTSEALQHELPVASDSPVWKLHAFARGLFHWQVGEEILRIPAGSWLLIPPGVKHGGVGNTRERGLFYWLHLRPDRLWPGIHASEQAVLYDELQPGLCPAHVELAPHWETLIQCAQDSHPLRKSRFSRQAGDLIHHLLEDQYRQRESGAQIQRMDRVFEYIEAHLDLEIRNEQLAELAGLRRSRFTDVFKAATGLPPRSYLQARRMERARELLRTPDLRIIDLALDLGFASSQAFASSFRKHCGMTPTQWRQQTDIEDPV